MNILEELNEEQRAAVEQIEGPCMIVAGAGSGKTRVLTYKIAFLIESGISPFEILSLTFTNKAANEMKERIFRLIGSDAANLWMGTFHSIFARILRYEAHHIGFDRNFSIYDEEDSIRLITEILKERGFSTENTKPQAVNGFIKGLKSSLVLPEDFKSVNNNYFEKTIETVYPIYQERLYRNNAMDFDDLLLNPIKLFQTNPDVLHKYQHRFKFILVDEYQDTNKAQYMIVKMLSEGHGNISIVGDDAQSIYRWRGAEIENIFKFETDFNECKVFKLEQNYRSTKNILSVADDVIKHNKRQIPKTLFTVNEDGEKVTLREVNTDREEAALIVKWIMEEIHRLKLNFKDFVVLYRTNAQSRTIEDALRMNSVPYVIVGGVKFYQRKEIKDVLAYLKILVNRRDNESMIRILRLREGIGDVTIDKVKKYAEDKSMTMSDALIHQYNESEGKKQTRIGTELARVGELIHKYRQVMNELDPGELARSLVDEIGIIRDYRNQGTEEAMDRMYNIQELLSGISQYTDENENPSLEGFLQEVSLVTDIDTYDDKKNAVTLMTSHAAKGLEYPVVFITGLEEGIFPLTSSTLSQEELEEERRLFYVSITRAMKKLYMTYSLTRYRFGMPSYQMRSRFLKEIDLGKVNYIKVQDTKKRTKKVVREEGSSISYEYYEDVPEYEELFDESIKIKKGTVVHHENFGKGKVVDITGKGESRRAQIMFDRAGLKNIILKYANLRIG